MEYIRAKERVKKRIKRRSKLGEVVRLTLYIFHFKNIITSSYNIHLSIAIPFISHQIIFTLPGCIIINILYKPKTKILRKKLMQICPCVLQLLSFQYSWVTIKDGAIDNKSEINCSQRHQIACLSGKVHPQDGKKHR